MTQVNAAAAAEAFKNARRVIAVPAAFAVFIMFINLKFPE